MIKIKDIKPNPNNPRTVNKDKFNKLVNSIKEFPKMMELRPIVVNSDNVVLGGNMRLKALKKLKYKELPEDWIKRAADLTDDEKRRFIIADNVGFGEWDWELLANQWDSEELKDWGLEIPGFDDEATEGKEADNSKYTNKIEAPVYEAKEEKPEIENLIDRTKTDELISKIEKSNLPEKEKVFLKLAAYRHLVFNYSKIADFYANSEIDTQDLMEDSALVIIDFDKAIEKGYVKLSEQIANEYANEYG